MNVVFLSGKLYRGFQAKNETAKATISVKRDFGGGYDYIDLVAFKNTATYSLSFGKGANVLIEGTWQTSKYKDKYYHTCIVKNITLLGGDEPQSEEEEEPTPNTNSDDLDKLGIGDDDDLPF